MTIDKAGRPLWSMIALAVQMMIPWTTSVVEAEEPPPSTHLSDLAWIAGDWVGGESDSFIQEQWSVPHGNDMMGMFRLIQGGKVVFYEFMTIHREASETVLRIKHFDPGLVGWEDKGESVVFVLQEIGDRRAVFETEKDGHPERLIFERSQNELVITLEKPAEDVRTLFRYKRRNP